MYILGLTTTFTFESWEAILSAFVSVSIVCHMFVSLLLYYLCLFPLTLVLKAEWSRLLFYLILKKVINQVLYCWRLSYYSAHRPQGIWQHSRSIVNIFEVEFEDTKGIIRIHKLKKNRLHNAKIKEKVQNVKQRSTKHTHKTKDRATQTPLKPGVNSSAPEFTVRYIKTLIQQINACVWCGFTTNDT